MPTKTPASDPMVPPPCESNQVNFCNTFDPQENKAIHEEYMRLTAYLDDPPPLKSCPNTEPA